MIPDHPTAPPPPGPASADAVPTAPTAATPGDPPPVAADRPGPTRSAQPTGAHRDGPPAGGLPPTIPPAPAQPAPGGTATAVPAAAGPAPAGAAQAGAADAALLARTAIIVVNYGSAGLLARNLVEVARQAPEAQVIVVDNYCGEAARAGLVELAEQQGWSTVLPRGNTGFGGGMNLGAARARAQGAELLVLLNPDAVIERDSALRLVARAAGDPGVLVGPVIRDSTGRTVSDGHVVCLADGSMRSRRSSRPVPAGGTRPWLSGACLALSGELFGRAGGFDARYFLYWEDVDFSARVLAAGGRLAVERGASAVHDEGATHAESRQSRRAMSDTYYYYNIRNRLLYAGLHLEAAAQRRWVATAAAAAREVVLRGGKRQLLSSTRPATTAMAATRDGLGLLRAARRGALPGPQTPLTR